MRKEFEVHILNGVGKEKAVDIGECYDQLANDIVTIVQEESPELTISLRKLEESCFYAKKAMAQQVENTESKA